MNNTVKLYGSDQFGLICGYVFNAVSGSRVISSEQAVDWLHQEKELTNDDFIWLHFNLAHTASEKWLARHLNLSDVFYERCMKVYVRHGLNMWMTR